MTRRKTFYVYIATNRKRKPLYTGVTNNIEGRMHEHTGKLMDGFTKRYNLSLLVYYETFSGPNQAIAFEKQIKGWRREKKIALI